MENKRSRLPLILVAVGVVIAIVIAASLNIPDAPTQRTEQALAAETFLKK